VHLTGRLVDVREVVHDLLSDLETKGLITRAS
jgi:hypothetical protein